MIQEELLNYMSVDFCYVGLIDTNHSMKSNHYHMIDGSCEVILGVYVYDIGILQASQVKRENGVEDHDKEDYEIEDTGAAVYQVAFNC